MKNTLFIELARLNYYYVPEIDSYQMNTQCTFPEKIEEKSTLDVCCRENVIERIASIKSKLLKLIHLFEMYLSEVNNIGYHFFKFNSQINTFS